MATHWCRTDPSWALDYRAGETVLVVHAGADHILGIDDVSGPVADEVVDGWARGGLDRAALSPRAGEVFDQLVTLGALRPAVARPPAPLAVAVCAVGGGAAAFAGALDAALAVDGGGAAASVRLVGSTDQADAVVYLRTNGTLAGVAEAAGSGPRLPHLLVDAAYHHTVSMGPLVVPGDTACLDCLAGRVSALWGDRPAPPRPGAGRWSAALAGLAAVELSKLADGQPGLVNRTVALDLRSWRVIDERVLKLPWCTACGPSGGRR